MNPAGQLGLGSLSLATGVLVSRAPRCLLLLLLLLLVRPSVPVAAQTTPAPDAASAVPGRLLVGLRLDSALADAAYPIPYLSTSRLFPSTSTSITALGGGLFRLDLTTDAASGSAEQLLAADPRVRFVEPDYLLERATIAGPNPFSGLPSDPSWPGQAEMRVIEANRAWEVTTGRPEIIIAVLDSGVLASHVDLAGKLLPGFDFVNSRPGAIDDQGHGTYTAALAAGIGNNGAGMAGLCWACRVLPLKILNKDGRGPASAFIQAIRYAVDNGARLINVSAGTPTYSDAMADAVTYASQRNVLVVAAAGNRPEARANYPAAFDQVLAVAATDANDQIAQFSTSGSFIDLAAPGVNVMSAALSSNDSVRRDSGTSAAAPLVTGAAGLVLSLRPELSVTALTNLLLETSIDIGTPGRDEMAGAGRLAVSDAVLAAAQAQPDGGGVRIDASETAFQFRSTVSGFAPNEPLRVWSVDPHGMISVQRGLVADGRGVMSSSFDLGPDAQAGQHRLTVVGDRSRRVAVSAFTLTLPHPGPAFRPLGPVPSTPDRLYFPETQHTLSGGFKTFWQRQGGLAIFGFPISEEFRELNPADGRTYTVQYFERNRFEYHPEHRGTEYEVQLGLLGVQLTTDRVFQPSPPVPTTPTQRYFASTRHSLTNEFLAFWDSQGGLAIFGYPISEPFEEDGQLVQYFERNRFELHLENPPNRRVLLGLLGHDLARRNGYR